MSAVAEKVEYTPEDLLTMPDGEHYELVDGRLVEQEMGALSSWVAGEIESRIREVNRNTRAGWVFNAECGYQCFRDAPRKVRKPDVSFIRHGRLPGEQISEGHISIPPDLAVEVVSLNDTYYEVDEKVGEYLRAGVRLLWVVNPRARSVHVYHPDGSGTRLGEEGELFGEDVLPGFRCPVRELFPQPLENPAPAIERLEHPNA